MILLKFFVYGVQAAIFVVLHPMFNLWKNDFPLSAKTFDE